MSLRIPPGGLVIPLDGSEIPPVKVEVVLDTWPYWLTIATGHADEAVAAHAQLLTAHTESNDPEKGRALEAEFAHAMQAISAAAFSLEAFYAAVNERIPADEELSKSWAKNRTARATRICETLIRAFKVTHDGRVVLRDNVKEILKWRDYAVHSPAGFREPIMHPDLGVGVEWRFIGFTASGSITAAQATLSIIKQCLHAPRSEHDELVKWSQAYVEMIDQLVGQWEERHGPIL
jgi:hypothetical protein